MEEMLYRMQMLMDCEELDALVAAEKLGSRKAYFEALTRFTKDAPALSEALAVPITPEGQENMEAVLTSLQNMLSSIGAPSLLWKTETLFGTMTTSSDKKLTQHLELLKAGIRALCSQIAEARITASDDESASAKKPPMVSVRAGSPEAYASCEKLRTFIENFELDEALAEVAELKRFLRGEAMDSALAAIRKSLDRLDYDASLEATGHLSMLLSPGRSETAARRKILAIDDVPDVLNSIKAILKEYYTVYCVTNHMAALKYLTGGTADLILLDIEMPDMNGFALLEIIRRIEAYKTTPVLFLTGSVSVENIKKTVASGGNDFIRKPVDPATLLSRVQKHLPDRP